MRPGNHHASYSPTVLFESWKRTTVPLLVAVLSGRRSQREQSGGEPPMVSELPAEHALADFPKDSRCRECMQATSQNAPHRRQSREQAADVSLEGDLASDNFGDPLTADHCVIADEAAAVCVCDGVMVPCAGRSCKIRPRCGWIVFHERLKAQKIA